MALGRSFLQCAMTMNIVLKFHYSDVRMGAMAPQITSLTIVYSTIYSCADQRKHQSSASLAFVRWIHQWPVTRKMFPFDDVIMLNPFNLTLINVIKNPLFLVLSNLITIYICMYMHIYVYICIYTPPPKVLGHSLLCRLHGNDQIWNAIFRQPNVVAWWKFAWVYPISSSLRKPCCLEYNRCNIHIFIT